MLHVCQPGFEAFLAKEVSATETGPGYALSAAPRKELCFAHYSLDDAAELRGESGRQLAQALVDYFLESCRDERFDQAWPLLIEGSGREGAQKRASGVESLFLELAKKRVSRVIKLAAPGRPGSGARRGLFAYLADQDRLFASRRAFFGGQRRMADDPRAPSRSYLKVEEAYGVLGAAPAQGELVVDLGAAPGGWSYSAARHGARVLAVDNGPLKAGAADNPSIEHRPEDAFKFERDRADWLFCDMVEDPDRVLALLERWLTAGRCRKFIVNLKFGRIDPLPLLRRARSLEPLCERLVARHLYHDREEITLVGAVKLV